MNCGALSKKGVLIPENNRKPSKLEYSKPSCQLRTGILHAGSFRVTLGKHTMLPTPLRFRHLRPALQNYHNLRCYLHTVIIALESQIQSAQPNASRISESMNKLSR